ncbi:protein terminal ear1-like [Phalaenopsis equestris]|uniref:protein terminal ear1-like n=1 Tax=Phalaenopsis equestris TaxID=78828 RepID=UPI0009E3EE53|nr:protein terminal ear1-like [Phalaenopsis equestris]
MEGGIGGNILDPGALEFYPSNQFGSVPAQIYFPYPPPPPPPTAAYHPNLQLHHTLPDDGDPSRAVILTLLPPHTDEASVMSSMESFGPVRSLDSASITSDGSATVHFYDLRSSIAAVFEIRDQHMRQQSLLSRQYGVVPANWGVLEWPSVSAADLAPFAGRGLVAGQAVWAQFGSRGVDGPNQGSIFISNCDPSLPSAYLAQLFGSLGDVKEVKETIWKPHQRFIEFYDIRDAARAVTEFNGKEVYGRRLVVEFSSTAGLSKRRSAGRHNRGGFSHRHPPPRLVRTASPHTGRWVAAAAQSSSSDQGGNRKIGKSGREDKKGKGRHEETASVQIGGAASSSSSSSSSVVAKQQHLSRRGWKNHSRNGGDSRFQFKEAVAMEEGSSSTATMDSRTTVMIKNIPNKYSQMLLLRMLDNHCIRCNEEIGEREEEAFSSYDFVYLPIDFNNKCNVGYGFVNLTSPEAAVRLHKAFHEQPWEVFNSRKICQVNYARLQGLEALKEHFKNSKFACDTDEYMPVVFCPPRDGKQLTEPMPVGGRGLIRRTGNLNRSAGGVGETEEPEPLDAAEASSTTASTHAPSDNGDGADDDGDDEEGDGGGDETASRLSQALLQLSYSS